VVVLILLLSALVTRHGAAATGGPSVLTEDDKIKALIDAIERLPGARFVRNDKEYDGPAAARHLRSKWDWQRSSIKTARDFIRLAATSSSQTGRPYLIRFADGRVMKSAEFLGNELDRLEGKTPTK
jgi:hypothetical protein